MSYIWCLVLLTWKVYFRHSCPQVWLLVAVHTIPDISLLLLVPFLPLLSSLIVSSSPCVRAVSKGLKLYGRIVICVVSWPLWIYLAFPEGFSLDLHILSPLYIRWPLSPLSHHAVILFPLIGQVRGVVLVVVPPQCVPPSILPQSLQGILIVIRRQLTLTRHTIILYLLFAPRCTYLRPVLVFVLGGR